MEENKIIENKMKNKDYNRYENSKIYKLIDPDTGFYYIGSTCGPLTQRLSKHKTDSKIQPEINLPFFPFIWSYFFPN